jgi:hypothetical protein
MGRKSKFRISNNTWKVSTTGSLPKLYRYMMKIES